MLKIHHHGEINAEGMTRDEIKFGRFINRLRSTFQEIIVKPLWIQMTLDYPDLMNDDSFKAQIGVKFNKYNIFEEMKEMELLQKTNRLCNRNERWSCRLRS